MSVSLNRIERGVLEDEVGAVEPQICIRSRIGVDAGRWWLSTPLWLLVLEDELVVLAAARRRYICRVSFADAQQTHYCHQTGELVIAPSEEMELNRIAMKPSDAIRVMRLLGLET